MKAAAFLREVRAEASKVTWSTPREVITSTAVVLVMVLITATFFLGVDALIAYIVRLILGL